MSRMRLGVGVAIVVVLAAALLIVLVRGITGSADPDPGAMPDPTPTVEDPSPSPDPTDNTEPIDVPTPDTTGRDFERVFLEINEFRNWLFRNPDPELVHLIYHRECDCYETTSAQLARFAERGLRFDDDGFRVEQVNVLEDFPSLARLHVALVRTPQVLVNEAGEVVESNENESRLEINAALVLSPQERWVVRTLTIVEQSQ